MKRPPKVKGSAPADRVTIGLIGAMALTIVLCVIGVVQVSGLDETPRWWRGLDGNPKNTEQMGIELENRITSALTRLRAPEDSDWTAAIDQDQLNSWMTHRLADTVRSFSGGDWIEQVGEVRTAMDHDALIVGARVLSSNGPVTVWAKITLSTDNQGRFVVRADRLYIGTTRVPASWASSYLNAERLGEARVDLGDGREVRIRGIRTGDRRLEFALRTQVAGD